MVDDAASVESFYHESCVLVESSLDIQDSRLDQKHFLRTLAVLVEQFTFLKRLSFHVEDEVSLHNFGEATEKVNLV